MTVGFNAVMTDPPWPIRTNRGTRAGRPGKSYPTLSTTEIGAKLTRLAGCLPSNGLLVVMAPDKVRNDIATWIFPNLKPRRPGVWWKVNGGMGYGLKRDFEDIHYWTGPAWEPRSSIGGVLPVPRGHDRYATSKPALLWHYLIEALCQPGWKILDPFAGGGSIREAAELLGCEAILWDVEEAGREG